MIRHIFFAVALLIAGADMGDYRLDWWALILILALAGWACGPGLIADRHESEYLSRVDDELERGGR